MKNDPLVLAIDLGSGGPKLALVSADGVLHARAGGCVSTTLIPGGGAEQDPEEWWDSITRGVRQLLQDAPDARDQIVAISCATQWSVTVPVDTDGRAIGNAIHWMDSRGAPYTRQVTAGWPRIAGYGARPLWRWIQLTGGVPPHSGNDALAHILFLKHERPETYRRATKLLEPMEYLSARLTGRLLSTPASCFPLLLTDNRDLDRVDWSPELLGRAGIDRAKLPDLTPVGSVIGPVLSSVAEEWGISPETKVVAGLMDSQAGMFGAGAIGDFEPHLCVGTSSWLTCAVPFKKTNIFSSLTTMPAGFPGSNMVVAEQGPAGKCLETVVQRWLYADSPGDAISRALADAATIPPGADGLLFLPWLNGAGPPAGDAKARGGFLNQSLAMTRAHAVRAVLEGVGCNLKWLLGAVERFTGRAFGAIRFVGGGARSDLWSQILADILNRPIEQVRDPEYSLARGAAFSAFLALGLLQRDEIRERVPVASRYDPDPSRRDIYDVVYRHFQRAYRANRGLFHRAVDTFQTR